MCFFGRARSGEDSGCAEGYAGDSDPERGRDRRGNDGRGIAMVLANAGNSGAAEGDGAGALDRGMATIRKNYAGSVKPRADDAGVCGRKLGLITPTLEWDGLEKVDLVIEAVFEGMALKKGIFQMLDEICKPGTVLASNTSTLSIDEIAGGDEASGVCDRHAFFQSGERDEAAGNRARKSDEQRSDRDVHAAFEKDR